MSDETPNNLYVNTDGELITKDGRDLKEYLSETDGILGQDVVIVNREYLKELKRNQILGC